MDAAATEPVRYIVWDAELKGFGLLVMPSGIKSYIYQYRTARGATTSCHDREAWRVDAYTSER